MKHLFLPYIAEASNGGINDLLGGAYSVITALIPIVAGITFVAFLWGIAQFMLHSAESGKREEGRKFMVWGVIALFVMMSVWGIVKFVGDNLNIKTGESLSSGGF